MLDERGKNVEEAGPSQPVSVLGLDGVWVSGYPFQEILGPRSCVPRVLLCACVCVFVCKKPVALSWYYRRLFFYLVTIL